MSNAPAYAKINLALVVGPLRPDGKHEVATVLQRVSLHDDVELEPAASLEVVGFTDDTLAAAALEALAEAAGVALGWRVRIEKRIPLAAGLGGGSSNAATALLLANAALERPLPPERLHRLATSIGADVPFFLQQGTQLATADGTDLRTVTLPLDYHVLLVRPGEIAKESTGAVYDRFDERHGARGFEARRTDLMDGVARARVPRDLALLPPNDLASSPLAARLEELGAFRADVSGAGPTVYGLFEDEDRAERAREAVGVVGETWLTCPL